MRINDRIEQVRGVAVGLGSCVKRHQRAHITAAVAPLMILNSTTRRHSMTTITLGTPSPTGFSGEPAHGLLPVAVGIDAANAGDARLRRHHAEDLGVLRSRLAAPKAAVPVPLGYAGALAAVSIPGMRWPAGMNRLPGGVRPCHDKAEPP